VEILTQLAHEQNYAVVVVTHNLEIADASDVVYRMSDGVLAKQGKKVAGTDDYSAYRKADE